jgi:pimeloyl-ACP methyl ester carboxylesterase
VPDDRRKIRAWGADVLVTDWDTGSGPRTFVVLHSEEGPRSLNNLVNGLRDSGRVVVPAIPGFDRGARLPGADRPHHLAYVLLDVLDGLGVTDCSLIGCSLGAWVALEMAVMEPRRFASVVAISPVGAKFDGHSDRTFAEVLVAAPETIAATLYADVERDPWHGRTEPEDLVERAEYRESFMHYVWEPYLHNPQLPSLLARITAPVQVIAGSDDKLVSPGYYDTFVSRFADGQLERITGAGHYPEIEKSAETVEVIKKFHSVNDATLVNKSAGRDS